MASGLGVAQNRRSIELCQCVHSKEIIRQQTKLKKKKTIELATLASGLGVVQRRRKLKKEQCGQQTTCSFSKKEKI